MAINLGSAYGKVSIDSSGVKNGVDSAKKSLGSLESSAQKLGATLQNIGRGMTVAITIPLALMAKNAVMTASAYEESLNKMNVVFGENSDVIKKWSLDAAKNLGMSQQQAIEAAATFGNLFTSMGLGRSASADMSTGLVQLAADLASFNNLDPALVLEKLRSGLVGEVEPLRTLGINLTMAATKEKAFEMGLADANGELSQAALLQARYALMLEQSTNAQGDFARTSQGLANQLRILKGNWGDTLKILGENLLPIVTKVLQQLNKWLEWFNAADPKTQKFIATLLLIAFVAGPLLIVFGKLLPLAFSGATKSLNPLSGGIFGLIGNSIKWLGVAALVVKALTALGIATGPVGAGILAVQAAIVGVGGSIFAVLWPIVLIIGTLVLLYLAFKNNFMGITDTAKQLWFIMKWGWNEMWANIKKGTGAGFADLQKSFSNISVASKKFIDSIGNNTWAFAMLYEDGSGALLDLAVAFGIPEKAAQDFLRRIWLILERFHELITAITTGGYAFTILFEDGSGALLNLATAFGIPEKAAQDFLRRIFLIAERVSNSFKNLVTTAKQLGAIIQWAFGGIGRTIDWLVTKVDKLKAALASIKLPKSLTPGSPTPFEMGLRGIASAMDLVTSKSFDSNVIARSVAKPAQNISSENSSSTTIHMASGLTLHDVDALINQKIERFTARIDRSFGGA